MVFIIDDFYTDPQVIFEQYVFGASEYFATEVENSAPAQVQNLSLNAPDHSASPVIIFNTGDNPGGFQLQQ